ncbi:MAG TPA: DedA family protein [Candidatus Paceibacterota bacterium]|nr:DedA family protein [Candidatus Paceibacterota bacterium]
MVEIISYISEWALAVIKETGYSGIFVLSALESAAIPIPSEVVIPFSGFLVIAGKFSLWGVVWVATLANLAGSIALFLIGRSGGRWFIEKYGRYFLIHKRDLDRADIWFEKHGIKAVFFSRMLPVVRTFISLPAGIARMNILKFSVFTFLGALPWNFTLAFIGYKAGENWNLLHNYFRKANIFIVLLIVVLIVWYIVKHRNKPIH